MHPLLAFHSSFSPEVLHTPTVVPSLLCSSCKARMHLRWSHPCSAPAVVPMHLSESPGPLPHRFKCTFGCTSSFLHRRCTTVLPTISFLLHQRCCMPCGGTHRRCKRDQRRIQPLRRRVLRWGVVQYTCGPLRCKKAAYGEDASGADYTRGVPLSSTSLTTVGYPG